MHRRNSHSPPVAVCGGMSWAASLKGEEMKNFDGTFYLTKWRHYAFHTWRITISPRIILLCFDLRAAFNFQLSKALLTFDTFEGAILLRAT